MWIRSNPREPGEGGVFRLRRSNCMPMVLPIRSAATRRRLERSDTGTLFMRCRDHRDEVAREVLVHRFLPLAHEVARRYQRPDEPLDDLIQVASLALVKAIDRFDPGRGVAFSTYAVPTMVGELKRHFRDTAWSVHLPRGMNERWLAVERAERELRASLRRSPTIAEVAERVKLSVEDVLAAMEAGRARGTLSLDAPRPPDDEDGEGRGGESWVDTLGASDERLDLVDEALSVASAVEVLAPREREVLRLRFIEEMTQSQIADRIGVSQMQVSRIIRRSLERLNQRVVEGSP
jgi:RNA polymerase sigma-B factor